MLFWSKFVQNFLDKGLIVLLYSVGCEFTNERWWLALIENQDSVAVIKSWNFAVYCKFVSLLCHDLQ